jgi:DNA-binding CsgD family transcriptional regulator
VAREGGFAVNPIGDTREPSAGNGRSKLSGEDVIGRIPELAAIDRFLGADSRALVLEGEPGIGKSILWQAGVDMARERGREVRCARPVALEGSLALAGLRDLLAETPDDVRERLPRVQQHALAVALAEDERASSVEGGVLCFAVSELLRALAAERGLVLAVDDLQWLDESSATILVYVLRRAKDVDVRLLATCRSQPTGELPVGIDRALDERLLTRVPLGPLSEGAIRRIVRLRLGISLTRPQLRAVQEAAAGNPFYSLELVRSGLRLDESGAICLPRSVRELTDARLRALPQPTLEALPFVAALSDPSESTLDRVGMREALAHAYQAGVLEAGDGRIRFTHPLVRAAAWESLGPLRRREVHRVLAGVVDDLEQRALHLAAASEPPDPGTAAVLEQRAVLARMRGAPAAAADLLDRALELTPADDLESWARLAESAAKAHAEASHWDSVWELVEQAQSRLSASPARAAILVTAAQMRPGLEWLLRQAVVEAGDTPAGVWARIGLLQHATIAGRFGEAIEEAREAVRAARAQTDRGLLAIALSDLAVSRLLNSELDGRRELEEALAIELEVGRLPAGALQSPRIWQAIEMTFREDPDAARAVFEERIRADLERGDETSVLQPVPILVLAQLFTGDWVAARETARAALDHVEALGFEWVRPILLSSVASVEARAGNLTRAREIGTEALSALAAFGDWFSSTFTRASLVLTELCAGDASAALGHAAAIAERLPGRECWWSYHQGDEIEALVLADERRHASERVAQLRAAGAELGLPRFLAWASRGEGLVCAAEGKLEASKAMLEAAMTQHERFPDPFERARTLLAYGHVLRRLRRRRAARATLSGALAEFERLGARHFAAATRAELKHVGGRPPAGRHELTGAEDRIARVVADGRSNKEVAAELYLALGTVEATLTRVYRKLGVTSRSQLASALAERDAAAGPRKD